MDLLNLLAAVFINFCPHISFAYIGDFKKTGACIYDASRMYFKYMKTVGLNQYLLSDDPVFVYNGGQDESMTPYQCLVNCMAQQAHQVKGLGAPFLYENCHVFSDMTRI